ncbi:MAG: YihY/virulence factor BrkB family protein [Flavobacteriales bacterium]|jgi:membrane protein|nr:YihY/virulence factor BrkB family protein [Flavobacteriales bacterium]MBK7086949.1 YihY/virulence factor BrkB family protein [Flavobacteriales bacterium]MBK7269185.1 YihY/virulence factor BrkB family protein [Flavobacteriales bacterium]MBK9077229.1 YihY/virulence factor BrkB family protein [Flavobacteriales bacterium]MBK9538649.1 YihY/virulence factor BrkB family protein [Flavobacteriales bacterium]
MWERIKRKALFSRAFRILVRWSKQVRLPGFGGFSLYAISRFFFEALATGRVDTRASAIAFKLFVAFFPAVIVLLTLIPYIPIDDLQAKLLSTFQSMLPYEVYTFVESTLHDLVLKKHGTLLSVSFVVGVYVASNSVNAILLGFSGSTNLTTWHTPFKQRMLSLGLLFALTILVMIAIPVLTISNAVVAWMDEHGHLSSSLEVLGLFAAKWSILMVLVLAMLGLLYNAGDPSRQRYHWITPGAILALVLILVLSKALTFVFSNITDYNALYGSIGAILAVQLWIYLNMIALLVGYELNISISRARHDHRVELRPIARS